MLRNLLRLATVILLSAVNVPGFAQSESVKTDGNDGISWMYVCEEGATELRNLEEKQAKELRAGIQGEFLWFQENGKAYLIKDLESLAEVHGLSLALKHLIQTMPKVSGSADESGLKAMREHSQLLRKKQAELHETILRLSRRAIEMGTVEPRPVVTTAP